MDQLNSEWTQYQKLVLAELERHSDALDLIKKEIGLIQIDLAMLKVKAGVWGLMGGLVPVVIALLMNKKM